MLTCTLLACLIGQSPDASVTEKTATIEAPGDCTFGRVFHAANDQRFWSARDIQCAGRLHGFDRMPSKALVTIGSDQGEVLFIGLAEVRADGSFQCLCASRIDDQRARHDRTIVRLTLTMYDGTDWRENFHFHGLLVMKP